MSKTTRSNYNVLMQVQSQNESERLISVFRSGGMAVRVHRVTSEQDLQESLDDSTWDLLIADNRHPEVSLQFSLGAFKKQNRDIPVILLSEEANQELREQAFKLGIQDVIDKNDNVHFVHAALREMEGTRNRLRWERLNIDFQELKKRAETLLEASDDGIAYVSDGILIKANEKFAEIFDHAVDDLDCVSIIDLVSPADQETFKSFFRHFSKGGIEQSELSFKGLNKSKEDVDVSMLLSNAMIDGEPCVQLTIRGGSDAAASFNAGVIDAATGLYSRYYLSDHITTTVLQVGKSIPSASLLLYRLDGGNRLFKDVGYTGLDTLIKDLASVLGEDLAPEATIARVADDAVAVILHKTTEKALSWAQDTIKKIEGHICELQERTYQYTCTCAVLQLNNKDADIMLDHGFEALGVIRDKHEKNYAEIFTPAAKTPIISADAIGSIDEAIELGCFKLLYQPLMSLHGDAVDNYEATFWFSDGEDESYPDALIKKAGSSKLDRWIILEATKALSIQRADGNNTRLIINLTSNALLDESLASWLGVAIKAANLTTDALVFQFREEDIKNNLISAIKTIGALRSAKFRVSVGEFGCDEEPFKLLSHLALDLVKFHTSLNADNKRLKALIDDAKENQLQTIVDEVDNASTLASMWQMGTHYIQGSYLQLPSTEMNFEFAELA